MAMNLRVISTHLECAYDLDILHYEETETERWISNGEFKHKQSCTILTNDGTLHVTYEATMKTATEVPTWDFKADIINGLRNFTFEQVKELVDIQMETEKFLSDGAEKVKHNTRQGKL